MSAATATAGVLVVGDAPEITPALVGAPIVRCGPREVVDARAPLLAAVLDLRAASVDELARARDEGPLRRLPLLVVGSSGLTAEVGSLLDADAAITLGGPLASAQLARALRALVALGERQRAEREAARIAESRAVTAEGPIVYASSAFEQLLDHPGVPTAAALIDARARIDHLGQRLLERERFDNAILDGLDVGIVTTDDVGAVTFANRGAMELLGLAEDVSGAPVERLLRLPGPPASIVSDATGNVVLAHPLTTAAGRELDLELTVSRPSSARDARLGYSFILRDVHERKRTEVERQRFERLAAVGTMVAGFAHEVRNPVAAMRSIAEELAEQLRDQNLETPHVALLLTMLERIERLVRTSLQFGRPAAPRRASHHPAAVVALALAELRARAPRTAAIDVDSAADAPDVVADDKQLAQALVILLDNALDATASGGRVAVRIREGRPEESDGRSAGSIRFEVFDDGPGVPPDLVGRIFDPFFTTKPTGTGLGLSIAQQIVSENGGRVEVSSLPGATTFALVLPPATDRTNDADGAGR